MFIHLSPANGLLMVRKIACRCEKPLDDGTVRKISLHCQVEMDQVVVVRDMPTIYQVPLLLREQKMVPLLLSKMSLSTESIPKPRLVKGEALWESWRTAATAEHKATVNIALVGKYVSSPDAYMSVTKALEHSAMHLRLNLKLLWIDAEHLEPEMQVAEPERYQKAWDTLHTASGLIVPGGFGKRGVLGMMLASKWAREQNIPFLGVGSIYEPIDLVANTPLGMSWVPSCRHAACERSLLSAPCRLGRVRRDTEGASYRLHARTGPRENGRHDAPRFT